MCNRPPKIEFAYLKLLPREYSSPRYIVAMGHRPDGRGENEERPGAPPPNQGPVNYENVTRLHIYA